MRTKIFATLITIAVALELFSEYIKWASRRAYRPVGEVLMRGSADEPISLEALAGISKTGELATYLVLETFRHNGWAACVGDDPFTDRWYPTPLMVETIGKAMTKA